MKKTDFTQHSEFLGIFSGIDREKSLLSNPKQSNFQPRVR